MVTAPLQCINNKILIKKRTEIAWSFANTCNYTLSTMIFQSCSHVIKVIKEELSNRVNESCEKIFVF